MRQAKKVAVFVILVVFLFTTFISNSGGVVGAVDNTITLKFDFEDGKTTGWTPRYGQGTIVASTEVSHGGSFSLKATDVGDGWKGPYYDLKGIASGGATFAITAWVMQNSGSSKDAVFQASAMTNNAAIYQTQTLETGVWKQFTGTFTLDGSYTSSDVCEFWIQGQGNLSEFYVDDVTITYTTTPSSGGNQDVNIIDTNFETLQGQAGWTVNGGCKVSVEANPTNPQENSFFVTNRVNSYDGAKYDLMNKDLVKDATYQISAKVYHNSTSEINPVIKMTLYIKDSSGKQDWKQVAVSANPGNVVAPEEWTIITGTYTLQYTGELEALNVYLEASDPSLDFYIDDVLFTGPRGDTVTPPPSIQEDIPSLKDVLKDNFSVGVAAGGSVIDPDGKNATVRKQLITKHFSSITPENEMKPDFVLDQTQTLQDYSNDAVSMPKFNFTQGDKVAQFAKDNGLGVRGHTLAWHAQTPDWLFRVGYDSNNEYASREVLLKRLNAYITTVINHYEVNFPGVIYAWDVVNEAIDTGGDINGLRTNWEGKAANWYTYLGPDFIEKAFTFADAAVGKNQDGSRKIKLFYNDYGTEDPGKRTAIFNLVKGLKEKGIIDGVGLQSHNDMNGPTVAAIEKTIDVMASLGLEVQLTEFDLNYHAANEQDLVKEGYRYKEIFDMLKKKNAVTNVTFWGLTDDISWLRAVGVAHADPLPFDKDFQAKPAFWGIVDSSKLPVFINEIKAYKGTPVIDGASDLVWNIQNPQSTGAAPITTFMTAWDDNNLYIHAKVRDSSISYDDSIEVMVDQNNDNTANDNSDIVFKINRDNSVAGADNISSAIKEVANGYNVEIKVPLSAPVSATKICGFDIAVSDGDIKSVWNNKNYVGEKVPVNYGKITFVDAPKITETIKGTPIIDGVIDNVWAEANTIQVNNFSMNTSGATATVKTIWDEDYIYVLADVTDSVLNDASPNAWEQDSLEIFLDENNAKTPSYQEDDVQYRVNYKNVKTVSGGLDISSFSTATAMTDKGYVVEMKIPHRIDKFASGQIVGFDAQINNANESGSRVSIVNWNDLSGNGWSSTSNYGILKLIKIGVTGVKLNKTTTTIKIGESEKLVATIIPENATNRKLIWTTSDSSVATVVDGTVKGLKSGTAIITVRTEDGGFSASCEVLIAKTPVQGVKILGDKEELKLGKTKRFVAFVIPMNATFKDVIWASSDESVATVVDGVVKAVGMGEAIISLRTLDGGYIDTCKITVKYSKDKEH